MALLTPPDPTEEVAQPALRPRSPTAEDPHPMIYTTCRGATILIDRARSLVHWCDGVAQQDQDAGTEGQDQRRQDR